MPIYEIKTPDGRIMEIKGDTPPSQAIVEEFYSKLPPIQPTEQVEEQSHLMRVLMAGQPGGGEVTPRQALRGIASGISKVAPYAAAFTPLGVLGQAGVTGVSRTVEGLAEEETLPQALKTGATSMVTDAALGKALKIGKEGLKSEPVQKVLKETASFFGTIGSSVPRESIEKVLSNPKILKTKDTFDDLGKKIKDGVQHILKDAKLRKAKETRALKKSKKTFNFNTYVTRQNKTLNKKAGKTSVYNEEEKRDIGQILKLLKKEDTPLGARQILDEIDNVRNLWKDPLSKATRSTRLEKKLKEIATRIRSKLKTEIDDVQEIRAANQEVASITEVLGKRVAKNKDAGKLLKRQQDLPTQESLQKLDDLLPESDKFLNKAENIKIKEQFSKLYPGQGGGSGGGEGFSNIIRAAAGLKTGGASLAVTSPLLQGKVLQTLPGIGKGLDISSKLVPKTAARIATPIQRDESGNIPENRLQQIKKERGL